MLKTNSLKKENANAFFLMAVFSFFVLCLTCIEPALASDAALIAKAKGASEGSMATIAAIINEIWLPLAAVDAFLYFVTKDQKKKDIEKYAFFGIIAARIIFINNGEILKNLFDAIGGWFS